MTGMARHQAPSMTPDGRAAEGAPRLPPPADAAPAGTALRQDRVIKLGDRP